MRKAVAAAAVLVSIFAASAAYAGEWRSDQNGWWYVRDDGSYIQNAWFTDTNGKSYYFGPDGYMLTSTVTPDGWQVGPDGAWVENAERQGNDSLFSKTGRGDSVSESFYTAETCRLEVSYSGERNFVIWDHMDDGTDDLLVNTIGSYDGSVLLEGGKTHRLEIKSRGKWSVKAVPLGVSDTDFFEGTGDYVTPVFTSRGAYRIGGDGDENFIVWGHCGNGWGDLLVNTIGAYGGTVYFNEGEGSYLEIICDGSWSVRPE